MDGHFLLELIGLFFTVIASMWVYEQYQQRRLKTIWDRIDEKQKMYFELFLKKEIYENDQRHLKEMAEEKNIHMLEFFRTKFQNLESKVDEIMTRLNGTKNHNQH